MRTDPSRRCTRPTVTGASALDSTTAPLNDALAGTPFPVEPLPSTVRRIPLSQVDYRYDDPPTTAVGLTCNTGTLTDTVDYKVVLSDNNKVVCNGSGKITIDLNDLGSKGPPMTPFRITMLSHGAIEMSGQRNVLALDAWEDPPASQTSG